MRVFLLRLSSPFACEGGLRGMAFVSEHIPPRLRRDPLRSEGGVHHTPRVATTGGTLAARNAGPSTASWPNTHNAIALTGR